MIKPVSKEINKKNLLEVCQILNDNHIDYSLFYGTALGIQREGDILSHDDDIDIIVNHLEINRIDSLFLSTEFKKTVFVPGTFLQISRVVNGEISYVDFYSYQELDQNTLVDKWNFRGILNNPNTYLHIPKNLLLPTKEYKYDKCIIRIPNDIDKICSFLYGTRYREKLIKEVDYTTNVVNNKPNILYIR